MFLVVCTLLPQAASLSKRQAEEEMRREANKKEGSDVPGIGIPVRGEILGGGAGHGGMGVTCKVRSADVG